MSQEFATIPSTLTRTVCIVAHVDHGKSSFADSLLAANGIISSRLAGQIRYLDSREDEQERGITMESSAVSLRWRLPTRPLDGSEPVLEEYRINLIDTPGHVDFSSEVSTASRLCDGALVLVDAVEGVCTQTITVLRQTHLSHLRPILVINKLDRLITELKLSPTEAYHHLSRIIEDVNAIVGSFYAGERMEDDWRWREAQNQNGGGDSGGDKVDEEYEERDDSNLYFDPANGNVIFSSALDGWGFRISRFAQLYAGKLGMSEVNLNRCLWGDWFLDPKLKRVVNRKKMEASGKKLKPLFVQFVLENIWAVYDAVVLNNHPIKVDKIILSLSLKIRPQDLRSKDSRNLLLSIFAQWLPLASSTFRAIIDKIPSPPLAQSSRMPKLLHPNLIHSKEVVVAKNKLEEDLYSCNNDGMVVAYVGKMFAVKSEELPENQRKPLTADDMRARAKAAKDARDQKLASDGGLNLGDVAPPPRKTEEELQKEKDDLVAEEENKNKESILGFARLFSGSLRVNQNLYALLPKYSDNLPPSHPQNSKHIHKIKIKQLYMMMGRELVAVNQVLAGNLFAVSGLEGVVGRNGTICGMGGDWEPSEDRDEDKACLVNLAGMAGTSAPIVRVALEPKDPSEMSKLVEGLKLLNQSDPCVETLVQETGEHVILTAGELHLERCLKDLRDRFARIEITVSPPIVPFRETAVVGTDMAPPKTPDQPRGTILGSVQSGLVTFILRSLPLPEEITSFLIANSSTLKTLQKDRKTDDDERSSESNEGVEPEVFWDELKKVCEEAGKEWTDVVDKIWSFGPRRVGPNLLIDRTEGAPRSLRKKLEQQASLPSISVTPAVTQPPTNLDPAELQSQLEFSEETETVQLLPSERELDENFDTAFQLVMNRGPLCAEPVIGMAYFLESVEIHVGDQSVSKVRSKWSNARGNLISAGQEAFRNSFLDWSPRLQLAMYSCDIQATGEVLGKVYGVVAKRRGRIVSEEMKEGTAFFTIRALLPVVESFGFADGIRTRTSGAASPQLIFHGYEILDQDPFWVPTTEEELEDLGEKADKENIAKKYMDSVRKRKGMAVETKVVEHAEKQKTMKNR